MLESTAMSSKGEGVDVVIAVIEYEDTFYEESQPYDVLKLLFMKNHGHITFFFQNSY